MNSLRHRQTGFTLIELLISLTIFVLVMLALFSLYDNYSGIFGSQQALFNIAGSASAAMTELQQTTMQADLVVGSHVFANGAYNSGVSTLILELPAMDEEDHEPLGTWDYVVFYVTDGKLYKLTEAAASSSRTSNLKQLSDTVFALTFTYDNVDPTQATKIDFNITTQARSRHQTLNYHLQQQVYLRNF